MAHGAGCYSVGEAHVGALIYGDRDFTLPELPALLPSPLIMIRTRNNNKHATEPADFLCFGLSASATVYVAGTWSGTIPGWL